MALRSALEITAADANRNFSELLRAVRSGRSVVVTVHGKPAAKIVPFDLEKKQAHAGRRALLARLGGARVMRAGRWTRESLYRNDE